MYSEDSESLDQDQMALNNYQESRKRLRSAGSSPACETDRERIKKEKIDEKTSWRPTDNCQSDSSGLYGLKPEYLRILGIEPPICNWVCVENFRCDKSELREVLELAGYVVVCSMNYSKASKHAKVMYSHPLEAVQAVSMLNKQTYYGRALSVTMIKYPSDSVILPKALSNIGPGFGTHGKPLRDIVKHHERFLKNKPNSLNALLFQSPNDNAHETKTDGTEVSQEDLYERFQFSKHIQIRNVEDDSDDSRSEKDSKGSYENKFNTTTAVSKYSPKSPSHIPVLSEGSKNYFKSDEGSIKKSFPANNADVKYSWEKTKNDMPSKSPAWSVGPVSGQINSRLPNPITQAGMINPNLASSSNGPRFGLNPHANPMAVGYRPNFGPTGQPTMMLNPQANPGGFGPNIAPMAGPRPNVPIPSTNVPGPMMPGIRPTAPMSSTQANVTVQFRNLPPTTTFAILSEKMSQCGQVMSLQLTTPGCATVVFGHPAHAQQCFQRYNNICVDGCVIQARII